MMAIDFIIGALLLVSGIINALALGAFWVMPGLRTTANRFVINLLIVNLVGCIILAPSLFSCNINNNNDVSATNTQNNCQQTELEFTSRIEQVLNSTIKRSFSTFEKSNNNENWEQNVTHYVNVTKCQYNSIECNRVERNINEIDVIEEDDDVFNIDKSRCWGFDFTAVLSAFSVLLIVGDTWCAITDPLRYHTRISELKAWILILAIWFLSIIVGIGSAFRHEQPSAFISHNVNICARVNSSINLQLNTADHDDRMFLTKNIYDLLFSCVFFIVIILLPICLVCAMYWKIFTEAKQNGLRMRQNGSSPLLQSALNLAAMSTQCSAPAQPPPPSSQAGQQGGLTMKIDKNLNPNNCNNNNNNNINNNKDNCKPLLTPTQSRRYLDIPKSGSKDKNHNIVAPVPHKHESNIKRNLSVRHLTLLDQAHQQTAPKSLLRQVHSSPNLHKFCDNSLHSSSIASIMHPTVHIPPKALSYMTSIRHRLSNASSIFKYREESRAARISILVVIMFLISYFPYGLLVLLQGRFTFIDNSSLLAVLFLLIANMGSPILFAYRNKRVRRGVLRLFGIDPKTKLRLRKHDNLIRNRSHSSTMQIKKTTSYPVNSTTKYLTPQLTPCRVTLTNHDRCLPKDKTKKINFSLFKTMRSKSLKLSGYGADSYSKNRNYREPTSV